MDRRARRPKAARRRAEAEAKAEKERIAREQAARSQKAQQPAKNYTVDRQKPAFKFKTPNLGGGGGAIDPLTGSLAAILAALGAIRLASRRKNNR